jgi:protein-tyrosine-phosphatase
VEDVYLTGERDLNNEYYLRHDMMVAASESEAHEICRMSMEEKLELKQLREERKQYDKKIDDLSSIIAENQKNFMKILADQISKIAAERDTALADRDMWKKSYEDLTKCL